MSVYSNIIGKGPTFPIKLSQNADDETGWYPEDGTIDLLKSDLTSLIAYQVGQRIRQESYGTRLSELLEEPNTTVLDHLVKTFISSSISIWEPRVKPIDPSNIKVIRYPTYIKVNVNISLRGDTNLETLTFNLDL